MALKLRWSESEGVVRAIDEPPGVIAVDASTSPPRFVIDGKWQPPTFAPDSGIRVEKSTSVSEGTPFAIDECVDACPTVKELQMLLTFAYHSIRASWEAHAFDGHFELVGEAVQFAIDTRDAVNRRADELAAESGGGAT